MVLFRKEYIEKKNTPTEIHESKSFLRLAVRLKLKTGYFSTKILKEKSEKS